jgi:hypothetical protein
MTKSASLGKAIGIVAIAIGIASIIINVTDLVLLKCLPYRIGPQQYTQYLWAERLMPVSFLTAIAASFFCLALRKRLLLILAALSLFALIVVSVPAGVHSGPNTKQWCYMDLREISAAKAQMAQELGLTNGTVVTPEQISKYIDGGFGSLKCFGGGTYLIEPIGTEPRCTFHGSMSEIEAGWKKQMSQPPKP